MMKENPLILIIEDHPLVSNAMAYLINQTAHKPKILTANSSATAIEQYKQHGQMLDYVFIDIAVPGAFGLSLIRQFHEFGLSKKCVVVSAFDDAQWIEEIKSIDCLGYIIKAAGEKEFGDAVASTLRGERVFLTEKTHSTNKRKVLTHRQQEIVELLYFGKTNKEIAKELNLALKTVNNYIDAILYALDACNRTHIVTVAIELGLIDILKLQDKNKL